MLALNLLFLFWQLFCRLKLSWIIWMWKLLDRLLLYTQQQMHFLLQSVINTWKVRCIMHFKIASSLISSNPAFKNIYHEKKTNNNNQPSKKLVIQVNGPFNPPFHPFPSFTGILPLWKMSWSNSRYLKFSHKNFLVFGEMHAILDIHSHKNPKHEKRIFYRFFGRKDVSRKENNPLYFLPSSSSCQLISVM